MADTPQVYIPGVKKCLKQGPKQSEQVLGDVMMPIFPQEVEQEEYK